MTLDESVRMALLVVLERLSPAERTAFVLHDVFGLEFAEIAGIVGRSAAACRKLASRARRRIEADGGGRFAVDRAEHDAVVLRFAAACSAGDLQGLVAVLDPGVHGESDSGGVIPGAPLRRLRGAAAVARQLQGSVSGRGVRFEVARVNGDLGVIVRIGAVVAAVLSFDVRDGRTRAIHAVGNPEKLAHLQPKG